MPYKDLASDKQIHPITIKLDREKPRELAFRRYLDENDKYGKDRKETIIRLFEFMVSNGLLERGIFGINNIPSQQEEPEQVDTPQTDMAKDELEKINSNDLNFDIDNDDFNGI